MDNIFELNTVNNVKDEVGASKVKSTSPVVEVFSALVQGKSLSSFDGKVVDKSVEHIKDLAGRAIDGDHQAVSELNAIQRFAIEPKSRLLRSSISWVHTRAFLMTLFL